MNSEELNRQYGIADKISFKNYHHTIVAEITNADSKTMVSLYGAQVLSYLANGKEDVLFMSSKSYFEEGKAIRGGIPVCWPWFGPHVADQSLPSHGFGRISTWRVIGTEEDGDELVLTLGLSSNEETLKLWSYQFETSVEVRLGSKLSVTLKTLNTDIRAFDISSALHSYFNVSDINAIQLEGLLNARYLDDVQNEEGIQINDLLNITGRIDRRYLNTNHACVIHDNLRWLMVEKEGSEITVVWNPGEELSKQMVDLGDDDYKKMLCVEAANSLDDTITILPGEHHQLKTIISVK